MARNRRRGGGPAGIPGERVWGPRGRSGAWEIPGGACLVGAPEGRPGEATKRGIPIWVHLIFEHLTGSPEGKVLRLAISRDSLRVLSRVLSCTGVLEKPPFPETHLHLGEASKQVSKGTPVFQPTKSMVVMIFRFGKVALTNKAHQKLAKRRKQSASRRAA